MQECVMSRRSGSGQSRTKKAESISGSAQNMFGLPHFYSSGELNFINVNNLTEETILSVYEDLMQENLINTYALSNSTVDVILSDIEGIEAPHYTASVHEIGFQDSGEYYCWFNKDNITFSIHKLGEQNIISQSGRFIEYIYTDYTKDNSEKAFLFFMRDKSNSGYFPWFISTVSEDAVKFHLGDNQQDIIYSLTYKNVTYYISSWNASIDPYNHLTIEEERKYLLYSFDRAYIYDGETQTNYFIPSCLFTILDNINIPLLCN